MTELDEILDDLFHGCAWAAFIALARRDGKPPASDETRRLAYEFYEQSLSQQPRNRVDEPCPKSLPCNIAIENPHA